ncbi:MAG: DUF1499 domain-containing protein [Spirochaeta sp.]|jgi:uncharacterized protein (DUF1499 family)|nr:DUF1499 domain-containing protein [Spirochaeta sp.]
MKFLVIGGIIAGVLVLIVIGGLIVLNRTQGGRSAGSPDLAAGALAPCPESPNCVSTQAPAEDTQHAVEPVPVSGTPEQVIAAITAIVDAQPRMEIVEQGDRYLRATATSALFRFVDDVDFLVDPEESVVHMRSASRVGESDMGVNRRRYEFFRAALAEALGP